MSKTKLPTGNPKGRPKKRKRNPGSNPIGRPKGEAGIMKDYRDRMLSSPKSRKVLNVIFDAALDDEHKNQAAAWKIIVDRIVPVSSFDKIAGQTTRSSITVNISGVPGVNITPDEPIEGDFVTVEEEEA